MLYREIIAVCSEIQSILSYRAVNTLSVVYKTSQLMLYREIIAVCSEIQTKHIIVPRSKHSQCGL